MDEPRALMLWVVISMAIFSLLACNAAEGGASDASALGQGVTSAAFHFDKT